MRNKRKTQDSEIIQNQIRKPRLKNYPRRFHLTIYKRSKKIRKQTDKRRIHVKHLKSNQQKENQIKDHNLI